MLETSRHWFWAIAAILAVGLCAQIGYTRFVEVEHIRSLERQLADLERESEKSAQSLHRQLVMAQSNVRRLRQRAKRAEERSASLQDELLVARSTAALLQERLSSAAVERRDEPPSFGVRVEPDPAAGGLVATAENRGLDPVQIVASRGYLWVGEGGGEVAGSYGPLEVAPETATDFFEYALPPLGVLDPDAGAFEGVLCLAYERATSGSSTWMEEHRFEYRPLSGTVAMLDRESTLLPGNVPPCQDLVAALR